jgi:hypothetical protein
MIIRSKKAETFLYCWLTFEGTGRVFYFLLRFRQVRGGWITYIKTAIYLVLVFLLGSLLFNFIFFIKLRLSDVK